MNVGHPATARAACSPAVSASQITPGAVANRNNNTPTVPAISRTAISAVVMRDGPVTLFAANPAPEVLPKCSPSISVPRAKQPGLYRWEANPPIPRCV